MHTEAEIIDAVKQGDRAKVESLIQADPSVVNARADTGESAFLLASYYGQRAIADLLRANGLVVVECALGDHDDFARLPWPASASDVVVTEKDAVKLPLTRAFGTRVWVAQLDFAPEAAFATALLRLLPPPRAGASSASPTDPHGNAIA